MKTDRTVSARITGGDEGLDRLPYFFWGFGLMLVKYNLDRAIAYWGFHRSVLE